MDKIDLEQRGKDFALIRIDDSGKRSEMLLSEDNLIVLAQSAQHLMKRILAARSRPEAEPVITTPVAQVRLNADLHRSEILLAMIDQNGAEIAFVLPLAVAQPLAERLPVRVAELVKAQPTKH